MLRVHGVAAGLAEAGGADRIARALRCDVCQAGALGRGPGRRDEHLENLIAAHLEPNRQPLENNGIAAAQARQFGRAVPTAFGPWLHCGRLNSQVGATWEWSPRPSGRGSIAGETP